jgi:stage III sporulation protein AF
MIEFIRQWIINIVGLVLFIVLIEILLPSGKIKRYVNLVTGTILILAILSPLAGVLGKNMDITALEASNSNILDKLQIENDSRLLEEEQMKQVVSVYREKIIGQLEQNAQEIDGVEKAKADIIFNEDYKSDTFGEIRRVYLEIQVEGNGANQSNSDSGPDSSVVNPDVPENTSIGAIRSVSRIDPIRIGKTKPQKEPEKRIDPTVQRRLEERIRKVFGVEEKNIIISQMKR